ncbi:nucleoside diphosphate kinase B-like [Juglans microcarpa x Juglans regia]|uniref:nucleoside diphosphate kinase B-like n=1 Tax=Juglans microcarpa x Juglans regia TaxID=2249226 RepID=UPI001B7E01D8|nr:nucleoside diphosphate kinase B-like [Juglans microcarpa x Juglans regia]
MLSSTFVAIPFWFIHDAGLNVAGLTKRECSFKKLDFVKHLSVFQVGEIISRFEKKGFYLKGLKLITVDCSFAQRHYADLSAKPFFNGLVEYIIFGPVVVMVWEGKNVVTIGRKIIGATNPSDSAPGTIRGDFAVEIGRNVIHGSDSVESGRKEIALWFPERTISWESSLYPWIYK